MLLQTIFASELAQIQVNLERHYLELEWLAHPDSGSFRAISQQAQVYAHQHQITKCLCDMQQAYFLDLDDQQWLVQQIFSAINGQYQHRYACLIQPLVGEVVMAYHIQDLVEQEATLETKISMAIFTDIDLAHQWLFSPIP